MKRICCTLALALSAMAAVANPFANAWFKGQTDKNPVGYKTGETMVFTLTPMGIKDVIPEGQYFLTWNRTGDDGIKESGKTPFTKEPFVYKTKIDKPGFVRLCANVVDAKGKTVKKIFFDGGAGADIDAIAGLPEPADFDAFWQRQREKLAKVPLKAELKELKSKNPKVKIYAVSVDCAGPRPVTGYLTMPKAVDNGKKFPCRLQTHGYGYTAPQGAPGSGREDEIVFNINAHGMKLPAFGGNKQYYDKLRNDIKSNGASYAFDKKQNSDPEQAYFNGMVLRVIRALQYLKTLPGWDGKKLIASGGSQGGLQTIWAAACGEGVTRAESNITWCCDLGGETVGRNRGNWYIRWVPALGYYDAANFAKRIPKTCYTTIPRAGLGDYVCPPSGLAILWNNMTCPKRIVWVQGSQHGYTPPFYKGRDTLRESK